MYYKVNGTIVLCIKQESLEIIVTLPISYLNKSS